jgi:NitT/TauT family transport system substrate-binding protein
MSLPYTRAAAMRGLLLGGLAAVAVPRVAGAQSLTTIRIATFPTDSGAQVYYAADLGMFAKAGLDAQISAPSSGAAIAAAIAGGAYDFGSSNTVSLALAHERGVPFVFAAAAARYSSKTSIQALIVSKNSTITTAKDLNGKVIAVDSLSSIAWLATKAWIDQNGGDIKSLHFLELSIAEMGAALGAGRVDAVSSVEPFLSQVLANNNGRILANHFDAVSKDCLLGEWFTTSDYAKAHPDIIRKFNTVMRESALWANGNQDLSAKILEKYMKVPSLPTSRRTLYGDRLRPAEIQPLIDVAARYGAIKAPFPAAIMFAADAT